MSVPDTSLLTQLHALLVESVEDRSAAVWKILARAHAADELAIALDFALDHDLIDAALAPLLRGDNVPSPQRWWSNPIDGTELVWIPPGRFYAGVQSQLVSSEGYFLARHPVTNRQFQTFMQVTAYRPVQDPQPETFLAHWCDGEMPEGQAEQPVVWVSLVDALAYCEWAELTLPTEWLWEKAARGIAGRLEPWQDDSPLAREWPRKALQRAQLRGQHTYDLEPLLAAPAGFGCEQLLGSVAEWCWPASEITVGGPLPQTMPSFQRLPDIELTGAVRGSCFKRRSVSRTSAAHRRRLSIYRRSDWIGFRPAFYPLAHRV